ncbi:MAG: alpha-amylase [Candidatus Pacebacteria bacterium CG_4_10_14_0_8_um_filter_42_14]|nr:MAG: alpha-amylase [Candidatus Pacebacteria bacterium CG_4_10_14_0_8_um_filter_42_14]
MAQICVYFQLHQPRRLADFSIFDLGDEAAKYVSSSENDTNEVVFHKVASKSYFPMLSLLKKLLKKYPSFVFSLSISGLFLEQAQQWEPGIVTLLQDIIATGQVEVFSETYYHSLASIYSPTEFKAQVMEHQRAMLDYFGVIPTTFRNTELIYSNAVAEQVAALGFEGTLTEAVPRYLGNRQKTRLYHSYTPSHLPILLKHAELSDDIAFRFSDKSWSGYPLTVEKYLHWLDRYGDEELINLFMDFETFGEHQWEDTGIFEFFSNLVAVAQDKHAFVLPRSIFAQFASEPATKLEVYDVPVPISWADVDRDLTAWIDNPFQQDSLRILYSLEKQILAIGDEKLIKQWRYLQTSDHFYYMCTKWANDGDVHAYFSPFDSPYEAYRRYSIVLSDIKAKVHQLLDHPSLKLIH